MTGAGRRGGSRLVFSIAMAAALAGCAPDAAYDAPRFPFRDAYAGRIAGAPVLLDNLAWWRGLREPALARRFRSDNDARK